ncbi:hypothetical protein MP638_005139 [Amoeboaphelidium occidentale]|nr:hypothetical protein MP638_005139 [Amoeboaphelidium occidentale]
MFQQPSQRFHTALNLFKKTKDLKYLQSLLSSELESDLNILLNIYKQLGDKEDLRRFLSLLDSLKLKQQQHNNNNNNNNYFAFLLILTFKVQFSIGSPNHQQLLKMVELSQLLQTTTTTTTATTVTTEAATELKKKFKCLLYYFNAVSLLHLQLYNESLECFDFILEQIKPPLGFIKKRVLKYYIPLKMLQGVFYKRDFLLSFSGGSIFWELSECIITGQIHSYFSLLESSCFFLCSLGVYNLLYYQLEHLLYRNLVKKVYLIHCSSGNSTFISSSSSTVENRVVPFNVLLAALRFATKDYGLDLLDLLSILCVLIEDRKLLRAVPSMKDNCMIVSKTLVFPKIVAVVEDMM